MSLARYPLVVLLAGLVAGLPGLAAAQMDAPSVTPRDPTPLGGNLAPGGGAGGRPGAGPGGARSITVPLL